MCAVPASLPISTSPLSVVDVRLQRGMHTVFEGLQLQLPERRIGLIGDNGAGKTSLLRLLCGLEVPQRGHVLCQGQPLHTAGSQRPRWVGMMFQNPDDQIIFPTVVEELALGLQPHGIDKKTAHTQARDFLAARGLSTWADRAVTSLSQGQRQQVCWLALLLAAPLTLLLDEPYASLDLPAQARLAHDIAQAPQQVIVSTHVLDHVRNFERVLWLQAGRIHADGPGHAVCAAYAADVAQRVAHWSAAAAAPQESA